MPTKIQSLRTQLRKEQALEKKDEQLLAQTKSEQGGLDALVNELEKLLPQGKSVFEAAKKQLDAPYVAKEGRISSRIAGEKKQVAILEKEIKAAATPPKPKPAPAPNPNLNKKQIFKGGDFSHWQSNGTFQSAIKNMQWAAIKATEGTGYVDPSFKTWWNEMGTRIAKGQQKLRIAYHFLDVGNGTAQAKHFLDTLGIHGKMPPGTRVALDWEASALSSPSTLRDAANYIKKVTGQYPLIYTSDSRAAEAKRTVPGAQIWDAHWGSGINGYQFQQISDGPGYDHDVFVGSLADLERFGGMPVK